MNKTNKSKTKVKQCQVCSKNLTISNRVFGRKICKDCYQKLDRKSISLYITKEKGKENLLRRNVAASAGRLILAILIVDIAVLIGGIFRGILLSLFFCIGALGIVNKDIFKATDLLEKRRWTRFWTADVIAYWIVYIPLMLIVIPRLLIPTKNRIVFELLAFLLACIVGAIVGFWNIYRTDKADKDEIVKKLEEWLNKFKDEKSPIPSPGQIEVEKQISDDIDYSDPGVYARAKTMLIISPSVFGIGILLIYLSATPPGIHGAFSLIGILAIIIGVVMFYTSFQILRKTTMNFKDKSRKDVGIRPGKQPVESIFKGIAPDKLEDMRLLLSKALHALPIVNEDIPGQSWTKGPIKDYKGVNATADAILNKLKEETRLILAHVANIKSLDISAYRNRTLDDVKHEGPVDHLTISMARNFQNGGVDMIQHMIFRKSIQEFSFAFMHL
jgi:hypothetical protein